MLAGIPDPAIMLCHTMQWDSEGALLAILCYAQQQIFLYTVASQSTVRLECGVKVKIAAGLPYDLNCATAVYLMPV